MPNTRSAKKMMRVAENRRQRNKPIRTAVRTYIRKARELLEGKELESAQETVKQAAMALDRAAQKGVIHPNNAARRKSRLMKKLNAIAKLQS